MKNANHISMATVYPYIRSARKMGVKIDYLSIGKKYGLDEEYLRDRSRSVPIEIVQEQARLAERKLRDPLVGLKAAQMLNITQLEGFKDLMFVGHNVKEALEIFDRYMPLFSEMADMTLEPFNGNHRLLFKPRSRFPLNHHLVDGRMMFIYKYSRCLGGQGFKSLHLTHACPKGYERQYQAAYQIPVYFDEPESYFELDEEWLAHEITNFQEPCYQQLRSAEEKLTKINTEVSLEEQVKFIIRRMLKTGKVTNSQVADALGLNVRTLQRRLKAKNIAYAKLLEETRKELSIEYLKSPDNSINKIATLVGYRDLSSFLRAFKSWTGMGPGQYRETFLKDNCNKSIAS